MSEVAAGLFTVWSGAVAVAAALAVVWRPMWPGYNAINFVAANFGQARNATDPKAKP